jgi:hypothetical protein
VIGNLVLLLASVAVKGNCDTDCSTGLPGVEASSVNVQQIIQIVLASLAAIAVLIIVLAGLKFVTSQGDPQGVAKARQAIIFALIGLAVAVSAEAIVTFALGQA